MGVIQGWSDDELVRELRNRVREEVPESFQLLIAEGLARLLSREVVDPKPSHHAPVQLELMPESSGCVDSPVRTQSERAKAHRFSADQQPHREFKNCWNAAWLKLKIAEGLTPNEMAVKCGVTRANIHYWVKKHGLKLPERKRG
jgi:hypothetical protein